jgi:hypothetical protein
MRLKETKILIRKKIILIWDILAYHHASVEVVNEVIGLYPDVCTNVTTCIKRLYSNAPKLRSEKMNDVCGQKVTLALLICTRRLFFLKPDFNFNCRIQFCKIIITGCADC